MKLRFLKVRSDKHTVNVWCAGLKLGTLNEEVTCWVFNPGDRWIETDELRAIADRLDELNGVGK